jgi:hypothetical protein
VTQLIDQWKLLLISPEWAYYFWGISREIEMTYLNNSST